MSNEEKYREHKKREITLHNVLSYIEGNTKYLADMFGLFPAYKQEQVLWRLQICKDDCVKQGECQYCGCPPVKKAYVEESCNGGDRFPNMMNEEDWENYKKENNITIETDGTGL